MKKLMFALVLGVLVVPVLAAPHGAGFSGGYVDWSLLPGYHGGSGGEFTLTSNAALGGLTLTFGGYDSRTINQNGMFSFQSFCIERDEHAVNPLEIWVSEEAAAGGGYGSGTHAWNGGVDTNTGDDLDPRTAYLYYKFATGTLTGYNYDDIGGDGPDPDTFWRTYTAMALQQVIWYLEGEVTSLADTSGNIDLALYDTVFNPPVSLVALANSWLTEASNSGWVNAGPVRVLQMNDPTTGALRQDMLWMAVPAPGAVLLAAFGLSMVRWLRRQ